MLREAPDRTIGVCKGRNGRASVTNDIEAVLPKVECWHQGSIAAFKIMYRDERGSLGRGTVGWESPGVLRFRGAG
jgi:hypothetical protein